MLAELLLLRLNAYKEINASIPGRPSLLSLPLKFDVSIRTAAAPHPREVELVYYVAGLEVRDGEASLSSPELIAAVKGRASTICAAGLGLDGFKKGSFFRLLAPKCLPSLRLIAVDEDEDMELTRPHKLSPWATSDTLSGSVPTERYTRLHRVSRSSGAGAEGRGEEGEDRADRWRRLL